MMPAVVFCKKTNFDGKGPSIHVEGMRRRTFLLKMTGNFYIATLVQRDSSSAEIVPQLETSPANLIDPSDLWVELRGGYRSRG